MIDREKVISGLHDIGGFIAGRIGVEQARNFLRTIDDVIELLKKQEAVKPISAFKRVNGTMAYSCPRCAALIVDGSYCKHCGQELKWE